MSSFLLWPPSATKSLAPKEQIMVRYELTHTVPAHKTIDFDKEDFRYGFSRPKGGVFELPKSGWYNIVVILNSSTGFFHAEVKKNGSMIMKMTNGRYETATANIIVYCSQGNTISVHTENERMTGFGYWNNIYIRLLY